MALSSDGSLLAVGRENNSIEIWKTDSFSQLLVIPGHKNVDLRGLHWIEPQATGKKLKSGNPMYYEREKGTKVLNKKRRLISTGLNGLVIEWDLFTQAPKAKFQANGAIWDAKVT